MAEPLFEGYTPGDTSVTLGTIKDTRTELHNGSPSVPSEVYCSNYIALEGPPTMGLGSSKERNFRPPSAPPPPHKKGGPAREKVRKQSREIRTQDGHWPQVPSTRKNHYLITSDATEQDKKLRQSPYHITATCIDHCFVLTSKA
jgi:hypothetical protein